MSTLKNNQILVTGATGFIGKSLMAELAKAGYQVTGIDLKAGKVGQIKIFSVNLLNQKQLDQFFQKHQFDIIVHLAARVPKSDDAHEQKLSLLENTTSTLNMLEKFSQIKAQKFIYASGVSVIGTPKSNLPVNESSQASPESLYVMGKYFGEVLAEAYRQKTGKNIVSLRISAPYGPGQNKNDVIPLFIQRALSNKDITIFGSGKRSQDFIYVGDVVRAILAAIKHNLSGIYNIGSGQSTSTIVLAKIILKNVPETKSKIIFADQKDPQENYRLKMNINRAKKELKFSPQVMIEEGIKKYIKYLKENQ